MTDPYPTQPPPQQPYQQGAAPGYPPQQYQSADPGQPHPQPTGFITPEQPKPSRKPLIAAVAAAVAVLLLAVAGLAVYDGFIKEDSGVAACKAMRDGKKIVSDDKSGSDDKMSEAEYREARELFEDSRHEDIREHGTALMDLAWQISKMPDDEAMGALAYMGPLTTHMSGLQTACADQDVIVDLSSK